MPLNINLIPHPDCREYVAWHNYMLDPKESAVITGVEYEGDLPRIMASWSSTKRNIYRQSIRKGYSSREITWDGRSKHLNDIFEINTSKQVRQGKPLDDAYRLKPKEI